MRERNLIESEQAVPSELLPGEQATQALDTLPHCPEWRARHQPHLLEPKWDAEPDAGPEPPRMQPRQRGALHRQERRVPGHGRGDAEADRQPLGGGERSCDAREGAGEEAVLREPQLAEAELLCAARRADDPLRGHVAA